MPRPCRPDPPMAAAMTIFIRGTTTAPNTAFNKHVSAGGEERDVFAMAPFGPLCQTFSHRLAPLFCPHRSALNSALSGRSFGVAFGVLHLHRHRSTCSIIVIGVHFNLARIRIYIKKGTSPILWWTSLLLTNNYRSYDRRCLPYTLSPVVISNFNIHFCVSAKHIFIPSVPR